MADRPIIAPDLFTPVINGVSMASTIISQVTSLLRIPGISYDIAWTGNPTGNFQIQVSNSYSQSPNGTVINAGNWNIIPVSVFQGTYPAPAGSAGNGAIDVVGTEFAWVRLVYVPTSGAGILTAIAAGKVL